MDTQIEQGEEINEVSLQAVLEDFEDRIEQGDEIVSV
jgi:hypothetical protein